MDYDHLDDGKAINKVRIKKQKVTKSSKKKNYSVKYLVFLIKIKNITWCMLNIQF